MISQQRKSAVADIAREELNKLSDLTQEELIEQLPEITRSFILRCSEIKEVVELFPLISRSARAAFTVRIKDFNGSSDVYFVCELPPSVLTVPTGPEE